MSATGADASRPRVRQWHACGVHMGPSTASTTAGASSEESERLKEGIEAAARAASAHQRELAARAVHRMGFKGEHQLGRMSRDDLTNTYLYLRSYV